MSQFVNRAQEWFGERSRGEQAGIVVLAFIALLAANRALADLAWLAFFAAVGVLIVQLIRRRPVRVWAVAAVGSLAAVILFSSIAAILYGSRAGQGTATAALDTDIGVAVATVLAAVVAVVGAYFFGVSRSRNERRDVALAEIFKEMMLFYRGVVAWTAPNRTKGPITEPNTTWRDYCRRQYEVFISAYQGNAIWLGNDTQELIQEVAQTGMDFLNGVDTYGRVMSNGISAWDWRANNLMPKVNKVQDALRSEVEASRHIIPYRIVIKKR